jgi:hypothetical protein
MNMLNEFYYERLKSKGFDIAMERYEKNQVLEISYTLCERMNEAASFLGIQPADCGCAACVEVTAMLIWPKFKSYGGKPNVIVDMTEFAPNKVVDMTTFKSHEYQNETPKKRTRKRK